MAKGINNDTRTVSPKKFKPNPKVDNGLCKAALVDVSVSAAEIKDDSPMDSFRGMSIPRLNFVFESRLDPVGVKKSTYILSYLPIEHTPESLISSDGGTAWKWDQMSQTIKHLIDVFRDNKPFTEEEEKLMSVDFVDEENGLFVEQPAEVVVEAYKKFFNGIVSMFKPGETAIYMDAKGNHRIIWMKLLLHIKGKMVNNGDFGFPGYIGDGIVEMYISGVEPSIYIKVAKGESIEPIAPAMSGATGGVPGNVAGVTVQTNKDIPDFMKK